MVEKAVTEVITDTITVEKVVLEKESDLLQNENIKKSFLAFVNAINTTTPDNVETLINFLDKEYAFLLA